MLTTYRYLIYSVIEAMKQTSDDAELKKDLVIFWTQVEVNRLRGERLTKRHLQSGKYLNHFYGIQVSTDNVRKYVDMPSGIVDLENDNGVHQVTYHLADYDYCEYPYDVPFEKTTPAKIWSLISIPIRKPSPTRPFMARENEKLFLYGIDMVSVSSVDMWLYTTVDTSHVLDIDREIELSEDQISVLIKRVFDNCRFASLMPNDKANDGKDTSNQMLPKTAVSQVPLQSQESYSQNQ
jgi:hypothetical protein